MAAVRRVRTPEGAKFYDLPIGSPITPDVVAKVNAAKAAKGLTPPKGALTSGEGSSKAPSSPKAPAAPKSPSVVKASSLSGPAIFQVGGKTYHAPKSTKVIRPKNQPDIAYAKTPDGNIHAFNSKGEIEIPSALKAAMLAKFGPDFKGDDNYDVEDAFVQIKTQSLSGTKPGTSLVDASQRPMFTKNADGAWENSDLGLVFGDDDVKAMVDSGDLMVMEPDGETEVGAPGVPSKPLAEMSKDEAVEALAAMPLGSKFDVLGADGEVASTVVKTEDGWLAEQAAEHPKDFSPISDLAMAHIRMALKEHTETTKEDDDAAKPSAPSPEEGNPAPETETEDLGENDPKPLADIPDAKALTKVLDAYPAGTVFKNKGSDYAITKRDDGLWYSDTDLAFAPSQIFPAKDVLVLEKMGEEAPAIDLTPDITKDSPDTSSEFLRKQEKGTKVLALVDGEHLLFEREGSGTFAKWRARDPKTGDEMGWVASSTEITDYLQAEKDSESEPEIQFEDEPDRAPTPSPDDPRPTPDSKPLADVDKPGLVNALSLYPAGTELWTPDDGWTITKQEVGNSWHDAAGKTVTATAIWSKRNSLVVKKVPSDTVDATWLAAAKPGARMYKNDDEEKTIAVLGEDGIWETFDGEAGTYLGQWAKSSDIKPSGWVTTKPTDFAEPDSVTPKPTSAEVDLPAGAKEASVASLFDAPVGSKVMVVSPSGVTVSGTKTGQDTWSMQIGDTYAADYASHDLAGEDDKSYLLPLESPQVGEEFTPTPALLNTLAPGTTVDFKTVVGNPLKWTYTKLATGSWMHPHGSVYGSDQMNAYVSAKVTNAPAPAKKITEYAPGDKVLKYGHLREMPVGATLRVLSGEYDQKKGYLLTKDGDGQWYDNLGGEHPVPPSELADQIIHGDLYLDAPLSLPGADETPTVQLWAGGPAFSKKDIADAVDALEAHSGFQIAYGLKSLPDSHVFANKAVQGSVKDAAVAEYPTLKPKQAFVQYLKNKAGLSNAPAATPSADAPKIHIGAATPEKKSIQGFNGGDFTQAEIQEAVDILEAFNGKLFKAELNKKGNPLGILDPNEIVGFDKDKTVTKQKFIDLLKGKVATAQASLTESDLVGYPVGTALSNQAQEFMLLKKPSGEWETLSHDMLSNSEVLAQYKGLVVQHQPDLNKSSLDAYPIGTKISSPSGAVLTKVNAKAWELNDPNAYTDYSSYAVVDSFSNDGAGAGLELVSLPTPDETIAIKTQQSKDTYLPAALQDKIPDPPAPSIGVDVKEIPVGDSLVDKYGVSWLKVPSGNWMANQEPTQAPAQMQEKVDTGYIVQHKPKEKTPQTAMPGTLLYDTEGNGYWYKAGMAGVWDHYTAQDVKNKKKSASNGQMAVMLEQKKVDWTKKWDGTNAADAPIGAVVYSKVNDGTWTKVGLDVWSNEHNVMAPDSTITASLGKIFVLKKEETTAPAWDGTNAEDAPLGAQVGAQISGGSSTFVKTGEDSWVSTGDGSSLTNEFVTNALGTGVLQPKGEIKKPTPDESKIEWDGSTPAKEAPAGAEVVSTAGVIYQKSANLTWYGSDGTGFFYSSEIDTWMKEGLVSPKYHEHEEKSSGLVLKDLPEGYALKHKNGSTWTKASVEDDVWVSGDSPGVKVMSGTAAQKHFNNGDLLAPDDASTPESEQKKQDGPTTNPSGLQPGKYATDSGKAYMVVHEDGTGTYVNSKGDVSKITVAKVKANYNAGMSSYFGVPDSVPSVTSPTKKKTLNPKDIEALPDGTYYSGLPSNPASVVYEVKGDEIAVFSPVKSIEGSSKKIGQKASHQWGLLAPTGSKIENTDSWWTVYGGKVFTKGDDGQWYDDAGEYSEYVSSAMKSDWYATHYKIVSLGPAKQTTIPKAKAQTLFAQGKLLDADGNSVVPKGYTGAVSIFGGSTTVPALVSVKQSLDGVDLETGSVHALYEEIKQTGLIFQNSLFNGARKKKFGEDSTNDMKTFHALVSEQVDAYLADVEVDIPDSNAGKTLFTWDGLGYAKFPEALVGLYQGYSTSEKSAYIKQVAAQFGDGKVIGAFYTKMDKWDKQAWINAFVNGDFKKMYTLEIEAAAKAGKPHPNALAHPGYPGNVDTHTVHWGPAVEGEVAAGAEVEGDWSTPGVVAPIEEINNYLIKAQMQHPEYLTVQERRNWVAYHRVGNKTQVDTLSVLAKKRKDDGQSPLTPPLTWTDDIKPAKVYDHLFDSTQWPTTWNLGMAEAYLDDHQGDADLVKFVADYKEDHGSSYYSTQHALQAYFQAKADKAAADALIPVYTKDPVQTVKKSTHPVFNYSDQFGKKYFFKPRPDTKLDRYRSEVEHLGNEFGRVFGFSTAESKVLTLDGKYGQLQADVGGVADLMDADLSTLTAQQIGDIGSEHVLDWFLDNDDSKGDNMKILPNGRIVGIDKGRAFKHFGAWDGLSADSKMDTNCPTVYNRLYTAIRGGKIDKERLDAAFLQVHRRAVKMSKVSDETITAMLTEGMKNRDYYDVKYKIDGKNVPQTFEGLRAAVLDRKSRMVDQIDEMWAKIYKDAGLGDLPEIPNQPLGEILSGVDDDRWHENILTMKATGASTMVASGSVIGGTVVGWTEDHGDTTVAKGKFYTTPKAQKTLLDYFTKNATGVNADKSQVAGFQYDNFGNDIVQGAKTINHHAVDGEYNQTKIDALQSARDKIHSDLDAWSPGLQANDSIQGDPAYKFPSGNVVLMQHVDQYKMMLDHYVGHADSAWASYEAKGKVTPHVETFVPIKVTKKSKFVKPDGTGDTFTVLGNGKAIKAGPDGVEVVDWTDADAEARADLGYIDIFADQDAKGEDTGIVVTKNMFTHEQEAVYDPVTKTKKVTGGTNVSGTKGEEYQVTLSTGEIIYFRNAGQTHTAKGQHGQVTFVAPDTSSPAAISASMERINAFLDSIGIDLEQADETSAELTYWREMWGILENRNHSGTDQAILKKVADKMHAKVKEIGSTPGTFLDDLNEKMTNEEQIQFWRGLWSEFMGDKVQKMLDSQGYLPKFDHQDWTNAETASGLPYWERFDVDVEELYDQDFILGHTMTSEHTEAVLMSGALLSGEERIRQIGAIYTGGTYGHSSALTDQSNGSSHQIYSRIVSSSLSSNDHNVILEPSLLLRTRTYSFSGDHYGNLAERKDDAPSHPVGAIKKFKDKHNETMPPNMVSLLDSMMVVGVDDAATLNKIIAELKKAGIEKIRGVPVEERIVLRSKMKAAIAKIKATWKKAA